MARRRLRAVFEEDSERILKETSGIVYDGGDRFNEFPDIIGKSDEVKNILNDELFVDAPRLINGGHNHYCTEHKRCTRFLFFSTSSSLNLY